MAEDAANSAAGDAEPTGKSVAADAEDASSGLRGTARWAASALAAIPSLTILATLLKAPEGEQFKEGRLFWAILFAALGAAVGITFFSRVLRPGEAKKSDIDGFDMSRLPDTPFPTIDELRDSTHGFQEAVADKRIEVADAEAESERASATSEEAKTASETVEKLLKENPTDAGLQKLAKAKRAEWSSLSAKAGLAHAVAASAARSLKETQAQLEARSALLKDVYRLKTADLVAGRYGTAIVASWIAVASVALGLFLLLTSTEERKPFQATLVKLTLEDPGKRLLGCQQDTVLGIQVAETDDGPRVITFPQEGCPSRTVIFKEEEPALGKLEVVEAAGG
jgi:hypothetical protein